MAFIKSKGEKKGSIGEPPMKKHAEEPPLPPQSTKMKVVQVRSSVPMVVAIPEPPSKVPKISHIKVPEPPAKPSPSKITKAPEPPKPKIIVALLPNADVPSVVKLPDVPLKKQSWKPEDAPQKKGMPAPPKAAEDHAKEAIDAMHEEMRDIEMEMRKIEKRLDGIEEIEEHIESEIKQEKQEMDAKIKLLELRAEELHGLLPAKGDDSERYLKELREAIDEVKKSTQDAYGKLEKEITSLKARVSSGIGQHKEPAVKVRAISLLANPVRFVGRKVHVTDCSVSPRKQTEKGWWHTLTDGTMEMDGFSKEKAEGEGTLVGIVRLKDGKPYVEF